MVRSAGRQQEEAPCSSESGTIEGHVCSEQRGWESQSGREYGETRFSPVPGLGVGKKPPVLLEVGSNVQQWLKQLAAWGS